MRRERDVWAEVNVGELLQQIRCPAVDEAGTTVDDQVLLQAGRLDLGPLDREGDTRIACDVLQFSLIEAQVARDDLVVVQADPDAGDLG